MTARLSHRRRRDRGAVAPLVAVMLTLMITSAAFAVDLGMQRVVRSDMQALADVVALDLARELGMGKSQAALAPAINYSNAGSALRQSVDRNKDAALGDVTGVSADWGAWDGSTWNTSAEPPTAVKVVASGSVGFAFAPGDGSANRAAYAIASSGACYSVGSYAAQLDSGNSVLWNTYFQTLASSIGVFNNSAAVRAIDYRGLASASVDLGGVATRLGIGSVDQLATSNVQLKSLFEAVRLELLETGGPAAVVDALGVLSTQAHTGVSVAMGRIIAVTSGSGAGTGAQLNLLDLVGGSLALLNGTNFTNLNVGAGLPGLANAGLKVRLIQGARRYCGRVGDSFTTATPATTEQLAVEVNANLNPVTYSVQTPALGLFKSGLDLSVTGPNNLPVTISVAPTRSTLTALRCTDAPARSRGVSLGLTNGLARVDVGPWYVSNLQFETRLLGIGLVKVTFNANVRATLTISESTITDYRIDVPDQAFDTFYPSTATGLGLSVDTSLSDPGYISVKLLDLVPVTLSAAELSTLTNGVLQAIVKPLFDASSATSLVSTLINPALGLAGIDLGGADISLAGTPAPECALPRLAG